ILMSCFLPSSVMLKSAGFRPLIGFPLLSFTVTSTTTNWVVVANLKPPLGAAGGGVCAARGVCGGIAETTSRPLRSVARMGRIVLKSSPQIESGGAVPRSALEPETQRGRHAAHVAGTGKQPQGVAPDGGVEAAECHVVQRVGGVEAQIDAFALGHPEGAPQRAIQAELRGAGDGIASRVAP